MALEPLLLGDIVDLRAGGHAAREALHAALEVGDRLLRPVGDDRDAVAGNDDSTSTSRTARARGLSGAVSWRGSGGSVLLPS